MRSFSIGGRTITQDSKPFVIAEIGNNHNGSLDVCKRLIKLAKQAGADAAKLQKRFPKELYTRDFYDSPYLNDNSFAPTYGLHREALEFDKDAFQELANYAKKHDILLFSTAFQPESISFLEQFDFPAYKVASSDLKSIPLIKEIARTGKPMIISTGGGNMRDIDRVYNTLYTLDVEFCFLHCVARYPTTAEDLNLKVINTMMDRYPDTIIGLSDHYPGIQSSIIAYMQGARIFEKHITVSRAEKGPDHAFSLEMKGLSTLTEDLHKIPSMLGTGEKTFGKLEEKAVYKMAKGIYSKRLIVKGTPIGFDNIAIKSPADGLEPYHLEEIQGKRAKVDLLPEQPITADVLENYST